MSCCKRPEQDGTCQNGHANQPEVPISARVAYALADELTSRAYGMREMLTKTVSLASQFDEFAGFLLRLGNYIEESRCELDRIKFYNEPHAINEARWLETQAQLYDGQHGVKERELASLIRSMSFLVAARGASLEQLRVMVEREGAGR